MPRQMRETFSPVLPRFTYCMVASPAGQGIKIGEVILADWAENQNRTRCPILPENSRSQSILFQHRRVEEIVRRRSRLPALVDRSADLVRMAAIDITRRVHMRDVRPLIAIHLDVAVLVKLHAQIKRQLHIRAGALLVKQHIQLDALAALGVDAAEE